MNGMVASRDTELQPSRFGLTQDMRVVQKVVCEPNSMVQVVMRVVSKYMKYEKVEGKEDRKSHECRA